MATFEIPRRKKIFIQTYAQSKKALEEALSVFWCLAVENKKIAKMDPKSLNIDTYLHKKDLVRICLLQPMRYWNSVP